MFDFADLNWATVIASGVVALIASFIAPWAHWGAQKRRIRLEGKRKLLAGAKRYYDLDTEEPHKNHLGKFAKRASPYPALKPYLSRTLKASIDKYIIEYQKLPPYPHQQDIAHRARTPDEMVKDINEMVREWHKAQENIRSVQDKVWASVIREVNKLERKWGLM